MLLTVLMLAAIPVAEVGAYDGDGAAAYTSGSDAGLRFSVTAKSSANGKVVMESGKTTYAAGEKVVLLARPYNGYQLSRFRCDGADISVSRTGGYSCGSFTMPAADITITADFVPIKYEITYVLNGGINSERNPTTYIITNSITLFPPH